jgi:DNA invertase Pin-like site-specific DNA recombinase
MTLGVCTFEMGVETISLARSFLGLDRVDEGVDTSTPNGRLVFGIFASIAEFEKELIRDRVRSGLAAARAKGRQLGRPRVEADAKRNTSLALLARRGARSRTRREFRTVRRLAAGCGINPSESRTVTP